MADMGRGYGYIPSRILENDKIEYNGDYFIPVQPNRGQCAVIGNQTAIGHQALGEGYAECRKYDPFTFNEDEHHKLDRLVRELDEATRVRNELIIKLDASKRELEDIRYQRRKLSDELLVLITAYDKLKTKKSEKSNIEKISIFTKNIINYIIKWINT